MPAPQLTTQSSELHRSADQYYRNELRRAAYEKRMSEKRKETPLPEADQTPEDNDNPLLIVLFVVIIVIAAWGLLMLGLAEIFVVGDA